MIRSVIGRPRFTLDTNILVYSLDSDDLRRHPLAAQIIDSAVNVDCWLTLQSLSEFYAASRKRLMPSEEAAAQVTDWLTIFPTVSVSADAIRSALSNAVAGRLSYWDALLVATAATAGCTVILSEDMQDGATIAGMEIHNPFAAGGGLTERTRTLLDVGIT